MRVLAVLAIPLLAYLDLWLTLAFRRVAAEGYLAHFAGDSVELNPRWQTAVDAGRWPGWRWLAVLTGLTAVVGIAMAALAALATRYAVALGVADLALGALLGGYTVIVGRNLQLLGTARAVRDHPDEIAGRLALAYPLGLRLFRWQLAAFLLPVGLVALADRSLFAAGLCLGCLSLMNASRGWQERFARQAAADGESTR